MRSYVSGKRNPVSIVNTRNWGEIREAMSMRTIPSGPNADAIATSRLNVAKAQRSTSSADHGSDLTSYSSLPCLRQNQYHTRSRAGLAGWKVYSMPSVCQAEVGCACFAITFHERTEYAIWKGASRSLTSDQELADEGTSMENAKSLRFSLPASEA